MILRCLHGCSFLRGLSAAYQVRPSGVAIVHRLCSPGTAPFLPSPQRSRQSSRFFRWRSVPLCLRPRARLTRPFQSPLPRPWESCPLALARFSPLDLWHRQPPWRAPVSSVLTVAFSGLYSLVPFLGSGPTSPPNENGLPFGKPSLKLARPERFELPTPWFVGVSFPASAFNIKHLRRLQRCNFSLN